jgi:muconolactone delta-isomerase
MASITFDPADQAEIERRVPEEQMRVRELQQQGMLKALYIPEGAGAPANLWVVFEVGSQAAVQQVLESLPLHPYMRAEVTPLRSLRRAPDAGDVPHP